MCAKVNGKIKGYPMKRENVALILPYAIWMVFMMALPQTPLAYAVRTVITAIALLWGFKFVDLKCPKCVDVVVGSVVGLVVLAIWVYPEQFAWYQKWCIIGEGGTKAIAESSKFMIALRLFGSAVIISMAEELFFRKWLINFAGFWWMVALFAIEHDRYLVGAIAGIVYGLLYLKRGLFAAILAHATTNFALGLWVIYTGNWQFW